MYNLSFESNEAGDTIDEKNAANSFERRSSRSTTQRETPQKLDDIPPIKSKEEIESFNPYDHGKEENATSFWGIVGHIVVISLGPTLLSIPATFIDTGYVTGVLGTIMTVFLYAYSMRTIITTEYVLCKRHKRENMTYMEVVENAFECGPPGLRWCSKYVKLIVYVVFLSVWIGGNSIVFILAGQNLKNAYDYFFDTDVVENVLKLYLVIPLMLLCWIPSLKMLVPFSTFTNIVNGICIVLILYNTLVDLPSFDKRPMFIDWTGLPMLMGVQLFSINATCLMLPFKNELKFPKKFKSRFGVITIAYVPVGIIYAVFGLLCYIKFGEESKDSIILNLPTNTFNKTMIALFGLGNCFFYSLLAYASFDIIWNNMLRDVVEKLEHPLAYEYVCRTLIAISSIVLAYGIPNLALFLAFTGTVGTSIDSLIVPALTEMLTHYKHGKYFLYVKDCLIIVFASILIIMGTDDCIKQLMKTYQ